MRRGKKRPMVWLYVFGWACSLWACEEERFKVPVDAQELPKDVATRFRAEGLWKPRPRPHTSTPPTAQLPSPPKTPTPPTSQPTSRHSTTHPTSSAQPSTRPAPLFPAPLRPSFAGFPRHASINDLARYPRPNFRLEPTWGHGDRAAALAVSPTGEEALTGGTGRVLLRWSLRSKQRTQTLRGFSDPIRSISYAPDGRRFAVLEGTHTVSIWSQAGEMLQRWRHTNSKALDLRFVPIEDQLLILSEDGALSLWKPNGQQIWTLSPCAKASRPLSWAVQSMQRWFAVGCSDGLLWLRSWEAGTPVTTRFSTAITALAISEDGGRLAAATEDTQIHTWDVDNKGALRPLGSSYGHVRKITQLQWFADGQRLLSGGKDSILGIWKITSQGLHLEPFLQHTDEIQGAVYHPIRKEIVSLDVTGILRTWSLQGKQLFASKRPSAGGRSLAFSPDGRFLLSDGEKGTAALWNMEDGQRLLALTGLPLHVTQALYAQDGNHLITIDPYNLLFWDIRARRQIDVIRAPKDDQIVAVARGYDWAQAFYGTTHSGVYLWTIAGQRLLYRHAAPQRVSAVDLYVDTRIAAAGTAEGMLYLYNLGQYQVTKTLALPKGPINGLRFSPDGKTLLVWVDRTASIYSVPALQRLYHRSFSSPLRSASFFPKADRIALGREDARLEIWHPAQNKHTAWTVCEGALQDIAHAPKHPYLAIACSEGAVRLWSLTKASVVWTGWPLPDKDWLSVSAEGEIAASRGGIGYFFFSDTRHLLTLDSFEGAWLDPKALQRRMQSHFAFPQTKKPPLPR